MHLVYNAYIIEDCQKVLSSVVNCVIIQFFIFVVALKNCGNI